MIAPLHTHLTRLLAAYTGLDAGDTQTIIHTHALLGEILAFRPRAGNLLLRAGWTQFDAEKSSLIFPGHHLPYRFDFARINAQEPRVMKKPVVVLVVAIIVLAVLGGGWMWYQSKQENSLTLYGNVDIRTVNLSFRVGGRLASLAVDEGDTIKSGQLLGELDKAPYENALLQAQANVSTAQAKYSLATAGYRDEEIARAVAAVNQARAAYDYAQNYYQRQLGVDKKPRDSGQ